MKKLKAFLLSVLLLTSTITLSACNSGGDTNKTVKVESVEVSGAKTNYNIGENFSLEGTKLVLRKSDNTTEEIDISKATIKSAPDMNTEGEKTVIVTFNGVDYSISFNVINTNKDIINKFNELLNTYKESNKTAKLKVSGEVDLLCKFLTNQDNLKYSFDNIDLSNNEFSEDAIYSLIYKTITDSLVNSTLSIDGTNIIDKTKYETIITNLDAFKSIKEDLLKYDYIKFILDNYMNEKHVDFLIETLSEQVCVTFAIYSEDGQEAINNIISKFISNMIETSFKNVDLKQSILELKKTISQYSSTPILNLIDSIYYSYKGQYDLSFDILLETFINELPITNKTTLKNEIIDLVDCIKNKTEIDYKSLLLELNIPEEFDFIKKIAELIFEQYNVAITSEEPSFIGFTTVISKVQNDIKSLLINQAQLSENSAKIIVSDILSLTNTLDGYFSSTKSFNDIRTIIYNTISDFQSARENVADLTTVENLTYQYLEILFNPEQNMPNNLLDASINLFGYLTYPTLSEYFTSESIDQFFYSIFSLDLQTITTSLANMLTTHSMFTSEQATLIKDIVNSFFELDFETISTKIVSILNSYSLFANEQATIVNDLINSCLYLDTNYIIKDAILLLLSYIPNGTSIQQELKKVIIDIKHGETIDVDNLLANFPIGENEEWIIDYIDLIVNQYNQIITSDSKEFSAFEEVIKLHKNNIINLFEYSSTENEEIYNNLVKIAIGLDEYVLSGNAKILKNACYNTIIVIHNIEQKYVDNSEISELSLYLLHSLADIIDPSNDIITNLNNVVENALIKYKSEIKNLISGALLNVLKYDLSATETIVLAQKLQSTIGEILTTYISTGKIDIEDIIKDLTTIISTDCSEKTKAIFGSVAMLQTILNGNLDEIDFNKILEGIELPKQLESVDFNKLMKKLQDEQTYENIFDLSNINVKTELNLDGSISKQIITVSLGVNFDAYVSSIVGNASITIELIY